MKVNTGTKGSIWTRDLGKPPKLCLQCGSVQKPENSGSGGKVVRGVILVVLLMCGLIPGLIYGIYLSTAKKEKCKVCGSTKCVPMDSPVAQRMLQQQPQ